MSKWPEDFVTNVLNDVEKYICGLFKHYGIYFDEIINGERHKNEVQCNKKDCVPSKLPSKYYISLHIDDERSVLLMAELMAFQYIDLTSRMMNGLKK